MQRRTGLSSMGAWSRSVACSGGVYNKVRCRRTGKIKQLNKKDWIPREQMGKTWVLHTTLCYETAEFKNMKDGGSKVKLSSLFQDCCSEEPHN